MRLRSVTASHEQDNTFLGYAFDGTGFYGLLDLMCEKDIAQNWLNGYFWSMEKVGSKFAILVQICYPLEKRVRICYP